MTATSVHSETRCCIQRKSRYPSLQSSSVTHKLMWSVYRKLMGEQEEESSECRGCRTAKGTASSEQVVANTSLVPPVC